ncbi:ribonucleoside triphosphate reductase [Sporohalobacter salinus]|uniref:ribonucleoside triphosphate reductase n=1 Tax=Sporohalobacter salinus TaxID=1494606 RepID=UPI001961E8C0|nr:ribonucleoside triphosphate reductase [Sporohalobacter salinus]MBM7624398.1 ribonucleoside-triphosphate reductase [Sporohalobacter salinus]
MKEYRVNKRDGREVIYNINKVKNAVYRASIACDLSKTKGNRLASEVATAVDAEVKDYWSREKKNIDVEEIQDYVELELMNREPKVAKSYIIYRYQHEKIRKLDQKFEDAMHVIDDYLNLDDWKVKENSNMSYSLQGLNNHISSEITAQYWLQEVYSEEISKHHQSGDIHIHDLSQLSVYCCGWDLQDLLLTGFGGVDSKVESDPPKHFDTALMQTVNFLYTLQGESSGAQAFSNFDTYLAPFIYYDDLSYEEVKQAMQEFIYNLNVPTRVGFQTPFTNITMDLNVPDILADQPVIIGGEQKDRTYSEFEEELDIFNRAFAEVMLEGDKKGRVFSFPIPTYNITPDFEWDKEALNPIWEMTAKYGIPYFSNFVNSDMEPEDVRSMCCRLRLSNKKLRKRGGGLFGANPMTGSIGVVTINLARIGYLAETEEEFLQRLSRLMDIARDSLETKRRVLEKLTDRGLYPYAQFYLRKVNERFDEYWKNHFNTIGILGMNEALLNFIGENIASESGREFALQAMDFMRQKLRDYQEETGNIYNLEATPGESTTYRFAKLDKEEYGSNIISANEDRVREDNAEPYYTNSTQLPVGYTDDIFTALKLQDELLTKYTGGCVHHGFVGERMPDIESTKLLVKRIAENFSLPYYSITPTFSICPIHGYLEGAHEYCPKCDAEQGYTAADR